MAVWTQDATDYLEGYLEQVAALARHQGDDVEDIITGLRDHIHCEVENNTNETVDIDVLMNVLTTIGTPKEVASLETPLKGPSRPPEKKSRPWYRTWLGWAIAFIILVYSPFIINFFLKILPFYF
ncbi:MAG: hypothetical protein COA73_03405 [Candidatus Hydrogenedentota bacterium]|nr:MAG: hypothetical protein COA73_03405 [Candidatus Hydrogenedentota bacterium]